jgi:deoxyribonuclease V
VVRVDDLSPRDGAPQYEWPGDADSLDREQERLAALAPARWEPPDGDRLLVGGCFLAYAPGEQGPGRAGDHVWAAAVVVACPTLETLASAVLPRVVAAPYERGHLALREGPALAAAVDALRAQGRVPDVLLVDATGRDHPRGGGLALQLGAAVDAPTVGVTQRTLVAEGEWPDLAQGATAPLWLGGEVVGAWVRTQRNVRPMAVHAGWRVDTDTAVRVVLASTDTARTPEPLRRARTAAREARAIG